MARDEFLTSVMETLEDVRGKLEGLNDTPTTATVAESDTVPAASAGTTKSASSRILKLSERMDLADKLSKKSDAELLMILSEQGRRKDTGVPFDLWVASGGAAIETAIEGNDTLTKALDSGSGSALIRQDLEPVLAELYVRRFPLWDRIRRVRANGLVHAYNQLTSFGDAQFMAELGTVTDDRSTYVRKTTNVSVLATRRGVSLKGQFAALQGGAGFNPEQLEMAGGLKAIAHKMQKTIFQGNASEPTGTASDEDGAYDPNAFDGLRMILDTARAIDVDPATNPETTGSMRRAFDAALLEAQNAGGVITDIWARPQELTSFNEQQDANVRYMSDIARASVGVTVQQVNTIFGSLGLNSVPGDSIGEYTDPGFPGGSATVADIYTFDADTVFVPYLGSEGPTVLDIPIGVSGQLVHLFIIFGMWGFGVQAPIYANKIRVKQ